MLTKNKVLLVTLAPKTHRTSEENLGLGYLKAVLERKNYEVEIIDGWLNEYSIDTVYDKIISQEDNVLFVGISSYMNNTKPTIDLISKLKEHNKNIKVACGGFGPTFYPNDYLDSGSDYVMLGEGEKSICELADCLTKGDEPIGIKNVGYKDKEGNTVINDMECLNDDLDSFPFPARDTIDVVMRRKSYVNMTTSRGCSGNCEFCSVISFFRLSDGKIWRTRSIKNIVDEIEQLYKMGVRHIKMVYDSFVDGIRDEKWCKDFADEIERRDIHVKLRGQIRADKITDGVLYHLKRAGFFSFACGIENGSQSALTRMNKKATLEENKKALQIFKKYGYIVQMGFILFDNETTYEELLDNYHFLTENNFTVTKGIFSEMFSAKGTKFSKKLESENKLQEGSFLSPNSKYELEVEIVARIYQALKMWQKSHSAIYDMTIDPLTAPKAIEDEYMREFYNYAMGLKELDLRLFGDVLKDFKSNGLIDVVSYMENQINCSKSLYDEIGGNVRTL